MGKKFPLVIFSFLLISTLSFGQSFKKEKRIYMLDITKSMWGLAGKQYDIFEEVREALYKGIKDINDPETMVTVVPFQATHTYEILESWTFKAGDVAGFNKMKTVIDAYSLKTVPGGYTDIYSALDVAKKNIDNDRVNYIFMLTDGEQSAVESTPTKLYKVDFSEQDLKNSLGAWCEYSKTRNVHLFYVMLTDAALDHEIVKIVKNQCNAYISEGTNINIAFIKPSSNQMKLNLHDNPEILEIDLVANNWNYIIKGLSINLELDNNSLFELKNNVAKLENNKIIIKLKRKNNTSFNDLRKSNPIESKIMLNLSTENDVEILNPTINISVRNKKEKVLTLEFIDNE